MTPSPTAAKEFNRAAIGLQKVMEKNRLANKHAKKFSTFFQEQEKTLLKQFSKFQHYFIDDEVKLSKVTDPKKVIDEFQKTFADIADDTDKELQKIVLDAEREGMKAGAEHIQNTISISGVDPITGTFDLANPRAVKWFTDTGGSINYIKDIQATTGSQLKTLITNAVDTGQSYGKTAKLITEKFDEFSRSRAKMIAINETGNAYESGSRILVDTLEDDGIKMEKIWMTSGDELVTPECEANGGEGWIPLKQPHLSGHQQPLRFPRCRCYEDYQEAPGAKGTAAQPTQEIIPNKIENAQSTQEVNRWFSKNYPDVKVDFTGVDAKTAKACGNQLNTLATKYETETRSTLKEVLVKPFESTQFKQNTYAAYGEGRIQLNPEFFDTSNIQKTTKKLIFQAGEEGEFAFHPSGCNSPESILTHEFGHLFYDAQPTKNRLLIDAWSHRPGASLNAMSQYDVAVGAERISGYAATNPHELFAETFAGDIHGMNRITTKSLKDPEKYGNLYSKFKTMMTKISGG
jgi:hypothetical protein